MKQSITSQAIVVFKITAVWHLGSGWEKQQPVFIFCCLRAAHPQCL